MSSRHRRRRSISSPAKSPHKTLIWIGIGTVFGLGALFGLSRLTIQEPEVPTPSPIVDQQLDDSIDSWFDAADEEDAIRRRREKAKRARLRSESATEAAAAKKEREEERLAQRARERRAAERARRTPPSKPVSGANAPPIELTEAERLAIVRDVLGPADTIKPDTTNTDTNTAGGRPGSATNRPASNAAEPSQLFSLLVMGSLGEKPIPRDDPQTWARIGYFLQVEAAQRFYLVHPDGSIKSILPQGYQGNPPPTPSAGGEPEYRLVIRASGQRGRALRFYGKQIANSYSCTLQCSIEQRRGEKYYAVDGLPPIRQDFTPTKPVPPAEILRIAYDMALQKLAAALQNRRCFQSRA